MSVSHVSVADQITAAFLNSLADGVNAPLPSWTSLTPASGVTANSFGYAPAYWLNTWTGEVKLRGGFAKSSTSWSGGTSPVLVSAVPAPIRPAQNLEFPACTTNSGNTNVLRVELTSAGTLTALFSAGMTGTYTWVSLDGISYYIT